MTLSSISHITLATTNLALAIEFYAEALGFRLSAQWADGAYLSSGSIWLCLARQDNPIADRSYDYSHIAFAVSPEDFDQYAANLLKIAPIWKNNRSEGQSLYFLDPDGHRLEIHVGDLQSRLDHYRQIGRDDINIY